MIKSFSSLTIRYIISVQFLCRPCIIFAGLFLLSTNKIGEIREKTKASGKSGSKQAYY